MPQFSTIETEFLVLRKTDYSETSLILAGLSPDCGQIHFLARGARKLGKKSFPVADLFRVLQVKYTPGKSDLHTWRDVEMVRDFSSLVTRVRAYNAASWLAGFALHNTAGDSPVPRFYRALTLALERLQKAAAAPAAATDANIMLAPVVCAGVVYLDENGLLPDYRGKPDARHRRDILLAAGDGIGEFPRIPAKNWKTLFGWLERTLIRQECRLPPSKLVM